MKKNSLFTIFLIALLIVGGIFIVLQSKDQKTTLNSNESQIKTGQTSSKVVAGKTSPYLEFTKTDYDKALASDKLIFLNFYADWCPICKAELPEIKNAFDSLTTDEVIGFQVNYNDQSTDQDEKDLAKRFEVTYQHTKIILRDGQKVLGPVVEQWNKEKTLEEINRVNK